MDLLLNPLTRIIGTAGRFKMRLGVIKRTDVKGGFYSVQFDDGEYVVGLTNKEVTINL